MILRRAEVAELLGVSLRTVTELGRQGNIRAIVGPKGRKNIGYSRESVLSYARGAEVDNGRC